LLGRNDQARAAYGEALTLYKQEDNRLGQANVLSGLGDLERLLGRNDQARAAFSDAAQLYEALGIVEGRETALEALRKLDRRTRHR
jgi:tetratricopeptide (TPR) repeat protein